MPSRRHAPLWPVVFALVAVLGTACGPGTSASGGPATTTAPSTAEATGAATGAATEAVTAGSGVLPDAGDTLDEVVLAWEVVLEGAVAPVLALPRPGGRDLWLLEQPGRIQRFVGDGSAAELVVDLQDRVAFGGERGLLGLAFAPDHAQSGRFFLHYSVRGSGATRVEAWTIDEAGARPEHVVLEVDQPAGNHNGGMIAFGPDGMLYVGLGDGGGGGDTFGNGQRADTLLGTILRLDVATAPYAVPGDNPYVGGTTADGRPAAPEVWAYGLRNPWRFWIDGAWGADGLLVVGDVGQNAIEEVDALPLGRPGGNLGWPVREGTACFERDPCDVPGLVDPIAEYGHDEGCSITGGVTYRGRALPALSGHWFHSDFCGGFLRSLRVDDAGRAVDARDWTEQVGVPGQVLSFGLDQDGEVLVLTADGSVRRLVPG